MLLHAAHVKTTLLTISVVCSPLLSFSLSLSSTPGAADSPSETTARHLSCPSRGSATVEARSAQSSKISFIIILCSDFYQYCTANGLRKVVICSRFQVYPVHSYIYELSFHRKWHSFTTHKRRCIDALGWVCASVP